ncbi:MAG TPA: DUF493 domain-containing protein [Moheibacter sp.]|nr:DUF493 domain-containing protein [Moheibacter sp.]
MENTEEFYAKFKTSLEETTEFPSEFTYKFILPTSHKKLAEIQQVFDGTNPTFRSNESKNGKYTSITVVIYVLDADQVIYYYKEVAKIEGVIML